MKDHRFTEDEILEALKAVKDPEIPVISVVHLGIISYVKLKEKGAVEIGMTPTFAGCPAVEVMKKGITETLLAMGIPEVEVKVMYKEAWSSNKVSAEGKQLLKEFGLAPPPSFDGELTLEILKSADCPKCGSANTELKNLFGPTACRSIHYCNNCFETFEQFKPL